MILSTPGGFGEGSCSAETLGGPDLDVLRYLVEIDLPVVETFCFLARFLIKLYILYV